MSTAVAERPTTCQAEELFRRAVPPTLERLMALETPINVVRDTHIPTESGEMDIVSMRHWYCCGGSVARTIPLWMHIPRENLPFAFWIREDAEVAYSMSLHDVTYQETLEQMAPAGFEMLLRNLLRL